MGAILTQNTSWKNVEKAIGNLKRARLLDPRKLARVPKGRLERLLRPSGFFRVKAQRLRSFLKYLEGDYRFNLSKMKRHPLPRLRRELLGVPGIGPETADSILLYALDKPAFVIDAYTRRIFQRHRLISDGASYEEVQRHFADVLPPSVRRFNEYHALLVRVGKDLCKKRTPLCSQCPLNGFLGFRWRGES